MISIQNNVIKTLFCFGVIAFLLTGFLGLSHFSMQMGMDGKMSSSDCPFMIGTLLCTMTPFEHISMWQSMFTALPNQNTIVQLILVLLTSIFCFIYVRHLFSPPKNFFSLTQKRLYQNQYFPVTYLQEAYSKGILNSKAF